MKEARSNSSLANETVTDDLKLKKTHCQDCHCACSGANNAWRSGFVTIATLS